MDAAFQWLLREKCHLTDWYRVLLADVSIEWRNCQPCIAPDAIAAWERLVDTFDADALLAFHLAAQHGAGADQVQELCQWQTLPRVVDHELAVLWSRGLSDLHVHAGGVRVLQAAWQDIMANSLSVPIFKELHKVYEKAQRDFRSDIDKARNARRALLQDVLRETGPVCPQASAKKWWRWLPTLLRQERRMLVSAWRKALDDSAGETVDTAQMTVHLDNYLRHKHRYCHLVRQPGFDTYIGLRYFDTCYFGALKRSALGPRHPVQVAFASSPRLRMAPIGDACSYLLESEGLQRIELRMAPFENAQDYIRFFKDWCDLQRQINKVLKGKRERLDIRFAVHFKRTARTMPTLDPRHPAQVPDAVRQLIELDRQSAALRAALSSSNARYRQWMAALARIDVAGQERDTQASLFTLHMRLLRGDPEAMQCLEDSNADHPCRRWLKHWWHLKARGEHRPSLTEKRLGMTVHAGEDFADVLDGLYQISSAVDGCALGAGDGIGHGLALATAPHAAKVPHYTMIPRGTHHDSLCWLYDRIENEDKRTDFLWARSLLRSMIEESGHQIYRGIPQVVSARCEDFLWVWGHKAKPLECVRQRASDCQQHLARFEYQDEILRSRQMMVPLDPKRQQLENVILWAQRHLLDEIKKKRIVIEMNPASNLRISGAESLGKSPTVALAKEVANGLLACVNTDNPGVFSSCIENEYALLLSGLEQNGLSQGEARNLLERIRNIGMQIVY
jgi:hypothetical protein